MPQKEISEGMHFKPEKIIHKYTTQEFWDSLYYQTCDEDDDYDGFMHICSTLDGSQIKIPIADIIHEASKSQNRLSSTPKGENNEK